MTDDTAAREGPTPAAPVDPWKGLRGIMAGTLVLEAIVIGLVLTVIPAPAPLPTPQEVHQQAEEAIQDVAGQIDAAAKSLFAPPAAPAAPQA